MKTNSRWKFFLGTIVLGVTAIFIGVSQSPAGPAGTLIARSQLRRVVDPSPRSAYGSVLMKIDANGKETFQVNVSKLGGDNFSQFFYEEPSYTTNYVAGLDLPPLARVSLGQGKWLRTLVGTNASPVDFLPYFGHLTELAGNSLDVSQPSIPTVTTIFTNIIGAVTNISLGVTNIVGATTNIINGIVIPNPGQTGEVFSVLWAPLGDLSAKPSALNYSRRGNLVAIGTASPKATAIVSIRFEGNTGRSLFKIKARNLTPGQQYTLFVANSTNEDTYVMIPVDTMTQKNLGSTATFTRDTKFGDPLPQQARDIGDLSGRIIEIRDAFDVIHLAGLLP